MTKIAIAAGLIIVLCIILEEESTLNKIRAEMLKEAASHSGTGEEVIEAYADGLRKGLCILDKHKEEREE